MYDKTLSGLETPGTTDTVSFTNCPIYNAEINDINVRETSTHNTEFCGCTLERATNRNGRSHTGYIPVADRHGCIDNIGGLLASRTQS